MDFNTGGSGGRPDDQSRPLYSGEAGGSPSGPPRGTGGGMGREFSLSDPVGSFVSTAREVLLNPVNFFRSIARQGDFVNPAIFALICALISALLAGILTLILTPLFANPGDIGDAFLGGVVSLVGNLLIWPIITAIGVLVIAGVFHLLVLLFVKPSNAGFEATFRIVCYASAIQLLTWIPIVNLLAYAYGVFLSVIGVREAHSTTIGKALLVVLIPVAVILLLVLILGAVVAALFFGASQQQF